MPCRVSVSPPGRSALDLRARHVLACWLAVLLALSSGYGLQRRPVSRRRMRPRDLLGRGRGLLSGMSCWLLLPCHDVAASRLRTRGSLGREGYSVLALPSRHFLPRPEG